MPGTPVAARAPRRRRPEPPDPRSARSSGDRCIAGAGTVCRPPPFTSCKFGASELRRPRPPLTQSAGRARAYDADDQVYAGPDERDLERHEQQHAEQPEQRTENPEYELQREEAEEREKANHEDRAEHASHPLQSLPAIRTARAGGFRQMTEPTKRATADVAIVGAGVIGLATAFSCASAGLTVILIDDRRPGEASPAAAGMLAPSLEQADGPARRFAVAARDRYPVFLEQLADAGGGRVTLNLDGILELPPSEMEADRLRGMAGPGVTWLEPADVVGVEPGCAAPFGALHHEADGAVDNVALVAALRRALATRADVIRVAAAAVAIRVSEHQATVRLVEGGTVSAGRVVLAAGAWSAGLEGLPRPLPVEPVRGQMVGFGAAATRHVLYGAHGYAVPRSDGRTIVGATMERVGFDPATTDVARAQITAAAVALCPALASAAVTAHWAGLRPVTPDLLPILGPDPALPRLLYACGHSRNGILMAALTGDCMAALVAGIPTGHDLGPFSVSRFS